ncbi:hypothetical protein SAMN04490243_2695 [Robiginitalea myxolifaciens]|uniref:Uncharacterized protein n=1 Tax=Robiginitalea myxolifaciens TaxID=400055 RepID=A0A1I6HFM5_9FLAO|nr:hypothetical protein [Robiginitalea myxolifaciens]SFR53315.1 hypothetical protein SAMN04490243_2695 [Robiginitalea myxolifaciens]
MKNYVLLLLLSLSSFFAFPALTPSARAVLNVEGLYSEIENTQYIFYAEAFNENVHLKHRYQTENARDFENVSMNFWSEQLVEMEAADADCTVTIQLKVRIGFGSNFVEASASVDGVPCDEVVEALVRLKEQLNAALK